MLIDDRNPAEHRTDNAKKSLIGTGKKKIGKADVAVFGLGRVAIDSPINLCCVTLYGNRSKRVFIDNICREAADYILETLAGMVGKLPFFVF